MNEIRRHDREAEEIARIREIVERHRPFPDFVIGFQIELGEFDGEPSMWILFQTVGERPADPTERRQRVEQLRMMKDAIHQELLAEISDRYPYYRFVSAGRDAPASS